MSMACCNFFYFCKYFKGYNFILLNFLRFVYFHAQSNIFSLNLPEPQILYDVVVVVVVFFIICHILYEVNILSVIFYPCIFLDVYCDTCMYFRRKALYKLFINFKNNSSNQTSINIVTNN